MAKKGSVLVCVPCGREVIVTASVTAYSELWCCGIAMDPTSPADSKPKKVSKKAGGKAAKKATKKPAKKKKTPAKKATKKKSGGKRKK